MLYILKANINLSLAFGPPFHIYCYKNRKEVVHHQSSFDLIGCKGRGWHWQLVRLWALHWSIWTFMWLKTTRQALCTKGKQWFCLWCVSIYASQCDRQGCCCRRHFPSKCFKSAYFPVQKTEVGQSHTYCCSPILCEGAECFMGQRSQTPHIKNSLFTTHTLTASLSSSLPVLSLWRGTLSCME